MQDTEGSSFVTTNTPAMKPLKIKLKEKTALSLNHVDSKEYDKGEELTSATTSQRLLFENLIKSGKADEVGAVAPKEEKQAKGQKTKTPDETKSTKKSKK